LTSITLSKKIKFPLQNISKETQKIIFVVHQTRKNKKFFSKKQMIKLFYYIFLPVFKVKSKRTAGKERKKEKFI